MKRTSIRISDEHAAKIKGADKNVSEVVKAALDLYFRDDQCFLSLDEALLLMNASIKAHESLYHKDPESERILNRVIIKKSETSDIVKDNETMEEKAEARWRQFRGKPIGESVPQKKKDNEKMKHARSLSYK